MTTFEFLVLFGMPIFFAAAGVIATVLFRRLHGRTHGPAKAGD